MTMPGQFSVTINIGDLNLSLAHDGRSGRARRAARSTGGEVKARALVALRACF